MKNLNALGTLVALVLGGSVLSLSSAGAQTAPSAPVKSWTLSPQTTPEASPEAPLNAAAQPQLFGVFEQTSDDHAIGAPDAPVTLIIYASVTCPHCASWFENDYPALQRDYVKTGKLRLIFREYPTSPAAASYAGFMIAGCAAAKIPAEQSGEAYFTQIAAQMRQQKMTLEALRLGGGLDVMIALGTQAGLTPNETRACLKDAPHGDHIALNVQRARAANVSGVPAMIIDGALYKSAKTDSATLSTVIDAAITKR